MASVLVQHGFQFDIFLRILDEVTFKLVLEDESASQNQLLYS